MDDTTKNMALSLAAGIIKKGIVTLSAGAVTHGVINSNQTETFVSAGMLAVGLLWSFWNDYGRAIVLSQLEVLKAKSLAQAAKLKDAGIPQVTVNQIAAQSPTMTPAAVTKAIATLPTAVQDTVAKAAVIAFALAFIGLMIAQPAQAQTKKLNLPIDPLGLNGTTVTGKPSTDLMALYQKLQTVSKVDLQYALNIANKKSNVAAAQCWNAIIMQIDQDQSANLDSNGQPLPTPDPHLFTDVERLSDVINSLGPNSPLMVGCGSFANQAKMNVLQLIGTILAGGAGLAAFAP